MNTITCSIGYAYSYLSKPFLQQNRDEVNQDESRSFYQTVAIAFFVATAAAYAIKKIYSHCKDTPELFWKELEGNQRPLLPN